MKANVIPTGVRAAEVIVDVITVSATIVAGLVAIGMVMSRTPITEINAVTWLQLLLLALVVVCGWGLSAIISLLRLQIMRAHMEAEAAA